MIEAVKNRVRKGGSTTDIVFLLLVLGLIGGGIWWLLKSYGKATEQVADAMIQTKQNATDLTCHMNLRSVYQTLQVSLIGEDSYPETKEELRRLCGDSRLLTCPDPNGGEYPIFHPNGPIAT